MFARLSLYQKGRETPLRWVLQGIFVRPGGGPPLLKHCEGCGHVSYGAPMTSCRSNKKEEDTRN